MPRTVTLDPTQPPARRAGPPHILLVRLGQADEPVIRSVGDYTDWFHGILEPLGLIVDDVAVYQGEALPYGGRYDGIVLSGSPHSVRDEAPWMRVVGRWALAMAAHTPVLAVCFGHQLVGEALGGRVDLNPRGPEWGTVAVPLTQAGRRDPLFTGLPDTLLVQQLHRDVVLSEPDPGRFTRLAGTENTPLQAFAVGPWLRAVQFHPELSAEALQVVFDARGWDPTHAVCKSDHGAAIIANWVRHYVRRAERAD